MFFETLLPKGVPANFKTEDAETVKLCTVIVRHISTKIVYSTLTLFWTGSGIPLYWTGGGGQKVSQVNSAIWCLTTMKHGRNTVQAKNFLKQQKIVTS